ncbi:hypothetical protein ACA910_013879 [Epithemia clementina (nom. ined.)]
MVVVGPRSTIFHAVPAPQAPDHVLVQTAKLATALVTGIYSQPTDKDDDDHQHQQDVRLLLAPRMFKQVIGKNYVDFSTGQQQDAAQFLQYFLEQSDRAEQAHKAHFMTTQTASSSSTTSTNTSVPTSTFFIHPPICGLLPPKRATSVPPTTRSSTLPKRKQRNDGKPFGVISHHTIGAVDGVGVPEGGAAATTSTTTTTTTAKERPDPKRHKSTTECEEGESTTTATTATMALTDDEEEGPSNNNNISSSTNGHNSNHDGSASEALSKCGTAASSNSSSTTTTTNSKNKNPHQQTGAAASSALQSLPAVPLPQISLVLYLDQWAAEHVVDDVRWPHLGPQAPRHAALRTTKMVNFPPYLILQLQRYRWGDDGQPQKLQVELLLNSTQDVDDDDDCKADKNDPNDNSDKNKNKNINIIDLAKYKAPGGPQRVEHSVPNDDDHEGGSRDATMSTAMAASFSSKAVAAATVAAAAAAVLDENAHELIFLEFLPQTGLDGRRGQQRRSGHGVGLRTQ